MTNGVLDPKKLDFANNVGREVMQAGVSTAIYGGDFKDNVIAAVGDAVAAPAFEYVGHTLTDANNLALDPNALSTKALITTSHALVGGTIAELSGGEFSSGAVASAVGHVVGEWMTSSDALNSAFERDLTYDEFKNQAIAIGKAVGGATVLLTQEGVSQEELNRATSMATSVVENNSLQSSALKIAYKLKQKYTKSDKINWSDIKETLKDEGLDIVDNLAELADGDISMDDVWAVTDLVVGFKGDDIADLGKKVKGYFKKSSVGGVKSVGEIKTYQTYTKTNLDTGEVYTGRTSGTRNPLDNVKIRDRNHHINDKGFGPARIDRTSTNKDAIRGREHQMINAHGGAKSQGGTSGNAINGVSDKNKNRDHYNNEANREFNNE